LDSILAGINYVTNNVQSDDIVNMSLWGPITPDWDDAVLDAADSGVRFTLIAGNAAADAANFSPGRVNHPNVLTMSAFREGDIFAETAPTFSNSGNPPIEFSAPGEQIPSLWRNGGTNTISGTSMAAPHVAGLLLACGEAGLETDGTVSNDPSPPADPIAWGNRAGIVSNITHSVVQSQFNPEYYQPKLDWDPTDDAIEYHIWRKHWQHDWKHWATVTSTTYTDIMTNSKSLQAVTTGQPQDYWVAYNVKAVTHCGPGSMPVSPKYFKYDPNDFIPTSLAEAE
jgi:subtilisin family serine protease